MRITIAQIRLSTTYHISYLATCNRELSELIFELTYLSPRMMRNVWEAT
jgi:hypothetical protein